MGKYIAINWSPGRCKLESLSRVIPKRRYTKGQKPTIHGKEAKNSKVTEDIDSQWEFKPDLELTELERRKVIAATLEIGIQASFGLLDMKAPAGVSCVGGPSMMQPG